MEVQQPSRATDIAELTWWFATPSPVYLAGRLAAQSYEPRPAQSYDLTTDTRLERMVQAASAANQSEWSRIKRIVDELAPEHRRVLHLAFGSHATPTKRFRYPDVAAITTAALERARRVARSTERTRQIKVAESAAQLEGCPPELVAQRVAEAEKRPVTLTDAMVREAVWSLLATSKDAAWAAAVQDEMQRLVDEARAAYRAMRSRLSATRREARAARAKEREALLDDLLGKKRARESARFEARLQGRGA